MQNKKNYCINTSTESGSSGSVASNG